MEFPLQLTFKIIALAPQLTVTDAQGRTVAYVKQKLFKLKEAVTVYTDASQSEVAYRIAADRILDFSATYRFTRDDGSELGALKRHGMRSLWQARYDIVADDGATFTLEEANPLAKLADSLLSSIPVVEYLSGYLFHPAYHVMRNGTVVARMQKQPALWEGKFRIEAMQSLDQDEQEQVFLGLLMLVLLERARG